MSVYRSPAHALIDRLHGFVLVGLLALLVSLGAMILGAWCHRSGVLLIEPQAEMAPASPAPNGGRYVV